MSAVFPPMTDEREMDLWRSLREQGSMQARHQLVDHYLPLAKTVAAQLYSQRADSDAGFDDYRQFAYVGLLESVDRYDFSSEATFSTFASYRIRGSILNGIQKLSERKEQAAFRARFRKERMDSLSENDSEARGKSELFDEMVEMAVGLALGYMLEDVGIFRDADAASEDVTYEASYMAEIKNRLTQIIGAMPEREQMVIRYHYYDHINFDHIAEILNIGKSRVSQLHKKALLLIREALLGGQGLDDYY
jgi:RNA polymerase sigma factor for flagellar operon FliA